MPEQREVPFGLKVLAQLQDREQRELGKLTVLRSLHEFVVDCLGELKQIRALLEAQAERERGEKPEDPT